MKNRYLAAFKEEYNFVGLASALALTFALGNPIPLLVGLVAEAAYLIFVPDTRWFMQRLSRRHDEEVEAHRAKIKAETLPQLRSSLRARFEKLESTRREIDRQSASDAQWMREVLRKLDFLLEKFLQFAVKDEQFRTYLYEARLDVEKDLGVTGRPQEQRLRLVNSRNPNQNDVRPRPPEPTDAWVRETVAFLQRAFEHELKEVEGDKKDETDESTLAILDKRLEVLQRRRDFIGKIGKIISNLSHQLSLLEDTFGLISDELLARPPEQVLADIDDVVSQTNVMTQVLEELAPYEKMLSSLSR